MFKQFHSDLQAPSHSPVGLLVRWRSQPGSLVLVHFLVLLGDIRLST